LHIVVTGGSGFLGSAVIKELKRLGHTAEPCDRTSGCDILIDPIAPCDGVIHLAGELGTAELFEPAAFDRAVDVNIKGVQRVLSGCLEQGVPYVGITMPDVWANVYQATKKCARVLATAWHESFGLPVSHVCAFNAFGPGQKYGPGHPQKILPTFSTLAWQDKNIPIWGDGEQTVDLISASEIARILIRALAFGNDELFDAGSAIEWTVNEVAEYVIYRTNSNSKIIHLPMRDGERPGTKLVASGLGWDLLGFEPQLRYIELDETIDAYA
jgi:UDP-glucose 4-epimerase